MQPYFQDKSCTIYHGDCQEILPQLEPAELVLTDIPYNISQDHNGLRQIDYGEWDKQSGMESEWCESILQMTKATAIVFCGKTQFSFFINAFIDAGLSTKTLIWEKPNPTVLNCDKLYIEGTELAAYGKRPKAFFAPTYKKNIWRNQPPSKRFHPTQKPLSLFVDMIRDCSMPGATVLDPFMGSGTTLRAAKDLGRKAIGIEIEERYCEIAAKRLRQEVLNFS